MDSSNISITDESVTSCISFLGVAIDTENGSSDPQIKKALDKSFKLLDIMENYNVKILKKC
jgi:hypothetical protein